MYRIATDAVTVLWSCCASSNLATGKVRLRANKCIPLCAWKNRYAIAQAKQRQPRPPQLFLSVWFVAGIEAFIQAEGLNLVDSGFVCEFVRRIDEPIAFTGDHN